MRKNLALMIVLFTMKLAFAQTYIGISTSREYSCCMKINADSSITFIYNTLSNQDFASYSGIIKQIKDSLFHVSASMTLGKFDIMWIKTTHIETGKVNDDYYFSIDSSYLKMLEPVVITYSNGQTENYTGKKNVILNKKLYNKKGDYYIIKTGATNKITGNKLQFKVSYGSFPTFENGYKIEFDLTIKGDVIKSAGIPLMQTGHFRMTKKSGHNPKEIH